MEPSPQVDAPLPNLPICDRKRQDQLIQPAHTQLGSNATKEQPPVVPPKAEIVEGVVDQCSERSGLRLWKHPRNSTVSVDVGL